MSQAIAKHDFSEGGLEAALSFFGRTRDELRALRKVQVANDWVRLFDINGDYFELTGLGYADTDIVPVLLMLAPPMNRGRPSEARISLTNAGAEVHSSRNHQ